MTRKMISLTGVVVAVLGFTVGSSDAEARHCRRQWNRCCQQPGNYGYHQYGHGGYRNNWANGSCCQSGVPGYQHTSNYLTGQTTYGTHGVAAVGNQPAPPAEAVAPAPAN